jgi:hypothetical protein
MSEFAAACDRFVQRLRDRDIDVRVIGAAALAAHGVSRATRDLDLLCTDRGVLDPDLWVGVASDGVELSVHVGGPSDPLTGVVRLEEVPDDDAPFDTVIDQLDLVVLRALWVRSMHDRPGPEVPVGTRALQAVDAADLILLKLYAGGPLDAWDITSLLQTVPDRVALVRQVEERLSTVPRDAVALWRRLLAQQV